MLGPLSKILATTPLNEAYGAFLEEARRAALTPEEKAGEKKRRAVEVAERGGKRVKTSPEGDASSLPLQQSGGGGGGGAGAGLEVLGDAEAAAAAQDQDQTAPTTDTTAATPATPPAQPAQKSEYAFYLHRPLTLSSGPTVLIPLRSDQGLDAQLSGKLILEFPRIYVFPAGSSIAGNFEVEGGGVGREDGEGESGESDEEEGVVESDTSSSGSSSEEEEESNEIGRAHV